MTIHSKNANTVGSTSVPFAGDRCLKMKPNYPTAIWIFVPSISNGHSDTTTTALPPFAALESCWTSSFASLTQIWSARYACAKQNRHFIPLCTEIFPPRSYLIRTELSARFCAQALWGEIQAPFLSQGILAKTTELNAKIKHLVFAHVRRPFLSINNRAILPPVIIKPSSVTIIPRKPQCPFWWKN